MRADEIVEGYIYADGSGAHFRKARQLYERKGVPRVRYWDSKGKHSTMTLEHFAAWASHVVATSSRPYPKKLRPPPFPWRED